jgi:hypothetical protein
MAYYPQVWQGGCPWALNDPYWFWQSGMWQYSRHGSGSSSSFSSVSFSTCNISFSTCFVSFSTCFVSYYLTFLWKKAFKLTCFNVSASHKWSWLSKYRKVHYNLSIDQGQKHLYFTNTCSFYQKQCCLVSWPVIKTF